MRLKYRGDSQRIGDGKTMGKRTLALVLVVIIAIATLGTLAIFNPFSNVIVERRFSGTPYPYRLEVYGVQDATIRIGFEDDPQLTFRVTYSLFSGERPFIEDEIIDTEDKPVEYEFMRPGDELVRVKSMNITFGSYGLSELSIDVRNCTILVDYDQNANLINSQMGIAGDSSSVVGVTLSDEVSFGQDGLTLGLLCGVLFLDLDLPAGLNGEFNFWSTTEINSWSVAGWTRTGDSYTTSSTEKPSIVVSTNAAIAHIWLNA